MVIFFAPQVRDAASGELLPGLVGQTVTIVAVGSATAVPIREYAVGVPRESWPLVPGSTLTVGSTFALQTFDTPDGVYEIEALAANGTRAMLESNEGAREAAQDAEAAASASADSAAASATAAQAAADAANSSSTLPPGGSTGQVLTKTSGQDREVAWTTPAAGGGGGASTWDQVSDKPATFPPSAHSHTATQISDATAVGRALLSANDAQSARAAIGAGTGNGTSNLALGSTSTTAAPGNHAHAASAVTVTPTGSITATNVQDALAQAAASGGGGGGSSETLKYTYRSGAYPSVPSSRPTGINYVEFYGPSQPTSVPSWIGNGANQAVGSYFPTPTS